MLKNLSIIIIAIALFIIGFLTYGDFLTWTLPKMNGLKFTVNTFSGQFKAIIEFSLTLALIPISAGLLWRYAPILKVQRRVLTVLIIIISICLFAYIRYQSIANEATNYLRHGPQQIDVIEYQMSIPLERFNIATYMFFGLIAGSAISYFLLRESKNSK